MIAIPTKTLRAQSARYRAVITWVTLVTLTILLLEHFGSYLVRAIDTEQVVVSLIVLAPQLCYLFGLWSLRPAFGEIAGRVLFGDDLIKALATLGWSLIAGAIISIFFVTNLIRIVRDLEGGFLNFDLSAIVLAVVGGALVLLSSLLTRARAMKAELDEII